MQTLGAAQTFPHPPQFVGDVFPFTSHPFAALPSQSQKPTAQAAMRHAPAVQAGVAFGVVQVTPHAPQLVMDDVRFVSQPSA